MGQDPLYILAGTPGDTTNGGSLGDFHLQATSPARNRGDATFLPNDTIDINNNGNKTEPLPLDLDSLLRVSACDVDLGAYEYQSIWGLNNTIDSTLCYNGSVTLYGNGDSLQWYSDAGLTNLVAAGDTLVNTSTGGNFIYYVTDSTINCPRQITDTAVLTIHALPTPNLGSDTTICDDDSLILFGGNFSSYLWHDSSTDSTWLLDANLTGTGTFTYTVLVTDSNGCQRADSITVEVTTCTGIDEFGNAFSVTASPNPTSGNFLIRLNQQVKQMSIRVLDVQGRVVYDQQHRSNRANLVLNQDAGLYLVHVQTPRFTEVIQIVIK